MIEFRDIFHKAFFLKRIEMARRVLMENDGGFTSFEWSVAFSNYNNALHYMGFDPITMQDAMDHKFYDSQVLL